MVVLAPFVISATAFGGTAQFAAASILAGSGSALAAITAAGLLNARYVPIPISVAQLFHGPRLRRLAESQLIVDESWALAGRGERFDRRTLDARLAGVGAGAAAIAVRAPLSVVVIVGAAFTALARVLLSGSRPPAGVHFKVRHGPTRRREIAGFPRRYR